ncbi:MAG TPA: DUF4124 domain-containing protein [Gammaproteobacteria bacterium]|nr:DUF4124 domain-containing protein [Gammaproteobacteria bacterium]
MLKCLIALTSLFSAAAVAQPVWTWVDDEGRRHYSDRPVEGATRIELSAPQTFEGAVPAPASPSSGAQAAQQTVGYTTFEILSPAPQETLFNTGSTMTVELATVPALRPAHRIEVEYDGERLPLSTRSLAITVTDVFRGEHTLGAVIVDAGGAQIARAAPVTFFVQQTSSQQPAPQTVSPAFPPTRPPVTRPRQGGN